jgi:hypothetical protein
MDELAAIRSLRPAQGDDGRAMESARSALRRAVDASRRRRWTRPRILVAVAVVAAGGTTAAAASGLGGRVIDFVAGEPAPPPVQRQLDLMSRHKSVVPWFRANPKSRAVASKARGVLAIDTSVGPVYLWVAPTRGGGRCYLIDIVANSLPDGSPNGGGGCDPGPRPAKPAVLVGQGGTRTPNGMFTFLHGTVAANVASVQVRFSSGKSAELEPAEGFILRELSEGEDPVLVIAHDEHGKELGRHRMQNWRPGPSDIPKPVGPWRTLIEIETSWGYPMTLEVAPGANGTVCTQTRYRGARSTGCSPRPPAADKIWVGHTLWNETEDRKPALVLNGPVGSGIRRLEVEYRDGGRAEVPIVEGHVLFELSLKREPKQLVGYGADGSVVARRAFR